MLRLSQAISIKDASAYAKASFYDKSEYFYFYFPKLAAPAANILKQEALAAGAELCTEKGAITGLNSSAILVANIAQCKRLVYKLSLQPFGLKKIAKLIQSHLESTPKRPKLIMQIINISPESFYQHDENFAEKLLNCQADIADIGACSSAPGRQYIEEVENKRLAAVFDFVKNQRFDYQLSIDTFSPRNGKLAIEAGFNIINDISANLELANIALSNGASYVLMHSSADYIQALKEGKRPSVNLDESQALQILDKVDRFFDKRLNQMLAKGLDISKVILDPGIGFGKNALENHLLIKHMVHFRHFKLRLLEGSSAKKSLGDAKLAPYLAANSDADIVRVHDAQTARLFIDFKERLNNL